jgi:hypothetical protein
VTERLGAAARQAGVHVVMGVDEREEHGSTVYNALLYFGPDGRLLGKHRKLMPTHAERLVWGMGDGSDLRVHQTGLGRVGGLICWQNYMPLARFAMYAQGVHTTRGQLVQVGADARRHLKALIVTAPEPLRQALRRRSWLQQARACAALQAAPTDSVEQRATVRALRLTAERILAVYAEAAELKQELRALITSMAPGLLDQGWGRSAPRRSCWPGHTRAGSAPRQPLPCSVAPPRSRPPRARSCGIGSTARRGVRTSPVRHGSLRWRPAPMRA